MIKAVAVAFFLLHSADGWVTWFCVGHGLAREANPFVAPYASSAYFGVWKTVLGVVLAAALYRLMAWRPGVFVPASSVFAGFLLFVVARNLLQVTLC